MWSADTYRALFIFFAVLTIMLGLLGYINQENYAALCRDTCHLEAGEMKYANSHEGLCSCNVLNKTASAFPVAYDEKQVYACSVGYGHYPECLMNWSYNITR